MYSAERYAMLAARQRSQVMPTEEEQQTIHKYIMKAAIMGNSSAALWANSPKEDCRKVYQLVLTYKSFLESLGFSVYIFQDMAFLSW